MSYTRFVAYSVIPVVFIATGMLYHDCLIISVVGGIAELFIIARMLDQRRALASNSTPRASAHNEISSRLNSSVVLQAASPSPIHVVSPVQAMVPLADASPIVSSVRPWPRYWARMLDVTLCTSGLAVIVGIAWAFISPVSHGKVFLPGSKNANTMFGWALLPFGMVIDAAMYSIFGNTPGKALLGLRATGIDGGQLSYRKVLRRNFGVYWHGLGTGFPLISLFTLAHEYNVAKTGKLSSWDAAASSKISGGAKASRTWLGAFASIALLAILQMMRQNVSTNAKPADASLSNIDQVVKAVNSGSPKTLVVSRRLGDQSSAEARAVAVASESVNQRTMPPSPQVVPAATSLPGLVPWVMPAWAESGGKVLSKTSTAAGELTIIEFQYYRRYVVRLGSVAILVTNTDNLESKFGGAVIGGTVKPEVIQALGPVRPFDQVFLMQQFAGGNACNGGPLWFLGTNADGSYAISDQIGFCGGLAPLVAREGDVVKVTLPGIPDLSLTENWVYQVGHVRKLASTAALPAYAASPSPVRRFNALALVGKQPWDIFDDADLDKTLRKLLGKQYPSFKERLAVAGPIRRDGDYVVGEGWRKHQGGREMGYVAIGVSRRDVHCAIVSATLPGKVKTFDSDGTSSPQVQKMIDEFLESRLGDP